MAANETVEQRLGRLEAEQARLDALLRNPVALLVAALDLLREAGMDRIIPPATT